MTTSQIELIKSTIPILKEHGTALTSHFYKRLFSYNPELNNVFNRGNQANGKQQNALATAVLAYAEHIENPAVLLGAIRHIGHKHTSLQIKPAQYDVVGNHLLHAISEVLNIAMDSPLIEAWGTAYGQLAAIMINQENTLKAEQEAKDGSWEGWRSFNIKDKTMESSEICSFTLVPTDGAAIANFQSGQYISVRVYIPALEIWQPRQYSLSSVFNGTSYRISVKREDNPTAPLGMVSNFLHENIHQGDTLEITMPAGEFVYNGTSDKDVFLSAGVGQTPIMAMLQQAIKQHPAKPIFYLHAARNKSVHAFGDYIRNLQEAHENLRSVFFYAEEPADGTQDYVAGHMDLGLLAGQLIHPSYHYYICGPQGFMDFQKQVLLENGVPKTNIFMEAFTPGIGA